MADSTNHCPQTYKYPSKQSPRYRVFREKINPVIMDLGAAAAKYYSFTPRQAITVIGISFHVTGEAVVATTTAPSVALGLDGVLQSGTGLSIPNTTAIGATVKSDLINIDVDADEVLSFHVNQIAVGGSIAGKGYMEVLVVDRQD